VCETVGRSDVRDRQQSSRSAGASAARAFRCRTSHADPPSVPERARGGAVRRTSRSRLREGVLRTYARYLGLDGDRFVAEYSDRHATEEEPAATPPLRIRRRRSVRDRGSSLFRSPPPSSASSSGSSSSWAGTRPRPPRRPHYLRRRRLPSLGHSSGRPWRGSVVKIRRTGVCPKLRQVPPGNRPFRLPRLYVGT
jgi:hypothetical protein